MKTSLLAASLGFLMTAIGTSANANTGLVLFDGKITADTCPIIISPPSGAIGSAVEMGELPASAFKASGEEYNQRTFALVVEDGAACGFSSNKATVTFEGTADASGNYFAVTPTSDGAKNVAIALRDRTGNSVAPGSASAEYDLSDTGQSRMVFDATYRATSVPVLPGAASASIRFTVDII
ncbi:fimbrial protein [Pseudomonas fulva]|uniref:fimbrial protein n=1 Tax=Pseudomonas fulva TaxID=47880 RepID=UPI0006725614|nr:fimbrial protein [Pseudomonas fulva]